MANYQNGPGDNRIRFKESSDEVKVFQKKEKKREVKWGKVAIIFIAYAIVFVLSLILVPEFNNGARMTYSVAYVMDLFRRNISNLYQYIIGAGTPGGINYIVIRYLSIGLIGAALAACGALMQGTFRNVLAGPSTMGVQTGGTLGNMIYVLFFAGTTTGTVVYSYDELHEAAMQTTFWARNTQQLLVLAGCTFGVLLILGIALLAGKGKVSTSAMILAGTVFSSVLGSFAGIIQYYIILKNPSDERIQIMRSLSMGDLNRVQSYEQLAMVAVVIIPILIILGCFSGKMNLLAFGEDQAKTMGMNVKRYKFLMIGASTVLTAIVTAYVGHIGFIGFMAPQIIRKLMGPNFQKLFPASIAFGALLLTIIYDAARVVGMTSSLNLFTSVIGAFVMLYTLLKKGGGGMQRATK